jgi:PAS domain S-box-containing protein
MVMTAQQQATILNVEDYAPGRYSRSRILKSAGFDVIEATTGSEALHLVRTRRPHLVLLDVNLPDITGFDVCRQIKEDPATAHVLVLQMSATSVTLDSKLTGLAAGSDGYLTEPIAPEELVANVNALLRLKRAEEAVREANATLRAVVEALPLAVIAIDAKGHVMRWSPAAEHMFGWHEEDVLGRPLPLVPAQQEEEFRSRVSMTLAGHLETGFETERLRRDGTLVSVSVSTAPLRDAAGEITGALAIIEDITGRKRAERELARLYAEANHAGRVKDEFLATLSHELRTPMNALSVWVHLLRRGEVPPDRVQYALEVIERNTTAQVRLIEDILDVSRIVSGKLRLQMRIVDLAKVVHAAIEMVRPAAVDRNITLSAGVPGSVTVRGDAQRLQQVVTNLLSNAVKFTPSGGRVELGLHIRDSTAVLEVADSGAGIDPRFLPRVFERFTQADSTTSRSHGGLGLGLAIVRYLVEAHQGSVAADSPGVGRGSTFRVALPLASAAEIARASQEDGDEERVVLTGIKVLVVDDDRDTRDLLQLLLTARGAMVRTAASVAEATALFAAERPGVVIGDIGMPGEDGYMLLERLRTVDPAAAFHAIAVSGYVSDDDRARARAAGFHDHLAKPLDIPTLMTTITRASAGRVNMNVIHRY